MLLTNDPTQMLDVALKIIVALVEKTGPVELDARVVVDIDKSRLNITPDFQSLTVRMSVEDAA